MRLQLTENMKPTDIGGTPAQKACAPHEGHNHIHGSNCGHRAVRHGDHIDYEHDGHRHRVHGDHVDECPAME